MTAQKPPSACQTVLWIDRHAHCGEFCGDWSVADSGRIHYDQVVISGLTGSSRVQSEGHSNFWYHGPVVLWK